MTAAPAHASGVLSPRRTGRQAGLDAGHAGDVKSTRMKTLLVLRHAKSSWDDSSLDDHERPLNARGEQDAPRIGALLRELRLTPDLIISSDAVRARLTAEAVASAAGYEGTILLEPRLYAASPAAIRDVVRQVRDAEAGSLMIIGHNPGLEAFVEQVIAEPQDMPTAALVQIAVPIDRWRDLRASTRGSLTGFWRPKDLP